MLWLKIRLTAWLSMIIVVTSQKVVNFVGQNMPIRIVDYCPRFPGCKLGAHVQCLRNPNTIKVDEYDPGCGNLGEGLDQRMTQPIADRLLAAFNAIRSKLANGQEIRDKSESLEKIPKSYGMFRLQWDPELATHSQVWTNQCRTIKRNRNATILCFASKKFPHPGLVWDFVELSDFSDPKSFSEQHSTLRARIIAALFAIVKKWYLNKKYANLLDQYDGSDEEYWFESSKYLLMIIGSTTHVGCGFSVHREMPELYIKGSGYRKERSLRHVYIVELACNFSQRLTRGMFIHSTKAPTEPGYSKKCGCPPNSFEGPDCLCGLPTSNNCVEGSCKSNMVLLPIITVEDVVYDANKTNVMRNEKNAARDIQRILIFPSESSQIDQRINNKSIIRKKPIIHDRRFNHFLRPRKLMPSVYLPIGNYDIMDNDAWPNFYFKQQIMRNQQSDAFSGNNVQNKSSTPDVNIHQNHSSIIEKTPFTTLTMNIADSKMPTTVGGTNNTEKFTMNVEDTMRLLQALIYNNSLTLTQVTTSTVKTSVISNTSLETLPTSSFTQAISLLTSKAYKDLPVVEDVETKTTQQNDKGQVTNDTDLDIEFSHLLDNIEKKKYQIEGPEYKTPKVQPDQTLKKNVVSDEDFFKKFEKETSSIKKNVVMPNKINNAINTLLDSKDNFENLKIAIDEDASLFNSTPFQYETALPTLNVALRANIPITLKHEEHINLLSEIDAIYESSTRRTQSQEELIKTVRRYRQDKSKENNGHRNLRKTIYDIHSSETESEIRRIPKKRKLQTEINDSIFLRESSVFVP